MMYVRAGLLRLQTSTPATISANTTAPYTIVRNVRLLPRNACTPISRPRAPIRPDRP